MAVALDHTPDRYPPARALEQLSPADFERLARLIEGHCGIRMPAAKRTMLEARLRKRLRALELESLDAYCDFLFSGAGQQQELGALIDAVTTNKTDFFREPKHFELLAATILPTLRDRFGAGIERPLRVWSAGCSSGKEAYTLAMLLSEFAAANPGYDFSILASDISSRVLEQGRLAVYPREKAAPIPEALQKKYLLVSRDPGRTQVRIIPELRRRVRFLQLNFMESDFGFGEHFDLIFCRNVMIYFDRPTQEVLLGKLCRHLPRDRYLFTGHSETLNGMQLPLLQTAPSVYRRL